ncbi:hypothetical protein LBMAG42_27800 [Deltaproteobacteria bacterium]|nr:hypothetical protein LBMAG42_27800 [Deltaproteobacteria bacterium]
MKRGRGQGRAEVERMVDALEQIHLGEGGQSAEGAVRAALGAVAGPDRVYAEATRLFSAQERILRAQSAAAGKLIEGLRARSTTPRQTVLRLAAPVNGVVGGRFVLHNESAHACTFSFRPGFSFAATFVPDRPTIGPGGRQPVDVRFEVDTTFRPGEIATLLVDILADGRPRLKLWLDVLVEEPS